MIQINQNEPYFHETKQNNTDRSVRMSKSDAYLVWSWIYSITTH